MLHLLWSHAALVLTTAASIFVAVHLLATKRSSQSLVAWLVALVFLPPVAIPLYFLLGTRKVRRPKRPPASSSNACLPENPIARVLVSAGLPPPREGNSIEVLGDGVAAYEALLALIRGAKRSIHMTFFILARDEVGESILAALAERAKEGLRVCLVLDGVGSRTSCRHASKVLREAGGMVHVFAPFLHRPASGPSNLRSHRKLAVFDGELAMLGGMNLAAEYMGPTKLDFRWRDVMATVKGPIVDDCADLFAADWSFLGGPTLPPSPDNAKAGDARLQLVPSGPDTPDDALYDALLTAIYGAKSRVTMVTPYYVPDDLLQRALLLAARRGVRVELVMPAVSNHALADFARRSLLVELLESGVHAFAYTAGMVHAKAMVVDDDFAFLGSPNLDMRSLYLNYEDALFAYGPAEVRAIAAFVEGLRDQSTEGAFDLRRRFWAIEQIARLVAPEL